MLLTSIVPGAVAMAQNGVLTMRVVLAGQLPLSSWRTAGWATQGTAPGSTPTASGVPAMLPGSWPGVSGEATGLVRETPVAVTQVITTVSGEVAAVMSPGQMMDSL